MRPMTFHIDHYTVRIPRRGKSTIGGVTTDIRKLLSLVPQQIKINRLHWFGHVQRMEDNRIPKKVLYMNLEATRLRGRPRNGWQDKVREDGRLVGGKGWKEKVYNREEWKKLLRTARNRHILHMPME